MGNYNKDRGGSKFSGKRDFGGRSGGDRGDSRGGRRDFGGNRGGDRERPQMHSAVCDDCGNNCEVPFRPTGDKPIFCSDCFRNKRGGDDSRNNKRDFGGSKPRREFNDRPSNNSGGENYKMQFDILNRKLDKILKALAPVISENTDESKGSKKIVDTKALKKELADVMNTSDLVKKVVKKKKATIKAVKKAVKKVTKKVAKEVAAKKPAVKKAVKKVVKKVTTKKAPAKKTTKKVTKKKK